MSDDPIDDHRDLADKAEADVETDAEAAAPAVPDERDAAIERLERAVAEEREHAATLRNAVEDLHFKTEILEKSYSKQLADARERTRAAEQSLAERDARIVELESARKDTEQLLTEARAELERIVADRGRLDRPLAPGESVRIRAVARGEVGARARESLFTIDELMEDSSWLPERQRARQEDAKPPLEVAVEDEAASTEMLSPELMFTRKRSDGG